MKQLFCIVVTLVLTTSLAFSQDYDPQLKGSYVDIGLEYGIDAGLGGNIGYTNLRVDRWNISHGSLSILYRDDGVDLWGDLYENIGRNEFSGDIVDSGYSYLTISGIGGIKILDQIHFLGSLEYKSAQFVQQRSDPTGILGNSNSRYHTSYSASDKDGLGVGAGAKFFLPMSNKVAFTPTIMVSTLRKVSISLGLAF